jgi:hypothetical protein
MATFFRLSIYIFIFFFTLIREKSGFLATRPLKPLQSLGLRGWPLFKKSGLLAIFSGHFWPLFQTFAKKNREWPNKTDHCPLFKNKTDHYKSSS